jgi:hypothetical protein
MVDDQETRQPLEPLESKPPTVTGQSAAGGPDPDACGGVTETSPQPQNPDRQRQTADAQNGQNSLPPTPPVKAANSSNSPPPTPPQSNAEPSNNAGSSSVGGKPVEAEVANSSNSSTSTPPQGNAEPSNNAGSSSVGGKPVGAATNPERPAKARPEKPPPSDRKSKPEKKGALDWTQVKRSSQPADPTRDLAKRSRPPLPIDETDVQEWSRLLLDERILLLTALDEDTADSAARQIQAGPVFRDHRWRALYFGLGAAESEFWTIAYPDLIYESETVVVVFGLTRGAERFFQSMPGEHHLLDHIRDRLQAQSVRLLILATEQSLGAAGGGQLKETRVRREVDFLTPLLMRDLPAERQKVQSAYLQCVESLAESQVLEFKRRLHRKLNSDEFKRKFASLTSPSERAKSFHDQIESAYEFVTSGRASQAIYLDKLLDEANPLRNAVLFVASFFENLSVEDFQRTLASLTKGQTITVALPPPGPLPPGAPPPPTSEKRLLSQVWAETRQALLTECSLRVGPSRTVDFEDGGAVLRQEVQRAFADYFPFLHDELFQLVATCGLMFDPVRSVRLGAQNLVAGRSASDDRYAENCIVRSLTSAAGSLGVDVPSSAGGPQAVSWILNNLADAKRGQVFDSLRELLAKLLDGDHGDRAGKAITGLMELGLHDASLRLIVKLWNHLRFGVLRVALIKRLIDQGDGATKEAAYQHIRISTSRAEVDIEGLLTGLCEWLPKDGAPAASPSAEMILRLLVDLSEGALLGEPIHTTNPIAAGIAAGMVDDFASTAAAWLFHPGLEATLQRRANEVWEAESGMLAAYDPTIDVKSESLIQAYYFARLICGWILPRGYSLTSDSEFYVGFFFQSRGWYEARLPEESRHCFGPQFRTLILADCVLKLAPSDAGASGERTGRLHKFLKEAGRLTDSHHRRYMPAHWQALAEAMLDARAFANDPDFPAFSREEALFKKTFAGHLANLRQTIRQTRSLFSEVGLRKHSQEES